MIDVVPAFERLRPSRRNNVFPSTIRSTGRTSLPSFLRKVFLPLLTMINTVRQRVNTIFFLLMRVDKKPALLPDLTTNDKFRVIS